MSKEKACRVCNTIYEGAESCPKCNSREFTDNFKGRIIVIDSEKSEIAKNIKIKGKGNFAIKTR